MLKKSISLLLLSMLCMVGYAQQNIRTLDQLINRGLEVNYNLELTRLRESQSQNNISISHFTPTVTGSARQNQLHSAQMGQLPDNAERWSSTNTLGAGVSLNWRLFDGMAMFVSHERQKELYTSSQLTTINDMQSLVAEVANQYYLIISLVNRVKVARESIELSQLRYHEALAKYNIGAASGLEMKLAKTDFNSDSSNLIKQIETLNLAYIQLNGTLNYEMDERGYVEDSIVLREYLSRDTLRESTIANNTLILLARNGENITDLDLRLAKSMRYPTLDFLAGYNYNGTDAGNFRGSFANSNGLNWGFNLSVNIFNGMETNRKIRSAKIEQTISRVNTYRVESDVMTLFNKLYTNYINNLQLIEFETENAEASRLNLEVAMERYRLGDLSGIDFRNIQQQYLSAVERKLNVIYQAKASEVSLLELASRLSELPIVEQPK